MEIKVRVSEVGGAFNEVKVPENSTVREALKKAGANIDVPKQVLVNCEEASIDDVLKAGNNIYVVPDVSGN